VTDFQREFYENGYANDLETKEVVAEIEALANFTRIARAWDLIESKSGNILDVGCGSGALLYNARNKFDNLIGVDIADSQLKKARSWASNCGKEVVLNRCNIDTENLPIEESSIDVAICMVVLEFLLDPQSAVEKIVKVLKPDGVLIASVGNIASWKNRWRLLAGNDPRTTTFMGALNGGALHFFTQATFIQLLECAGLKVDAVSCSGRLWQVKEKWPSLLAGDIIIVARKM